MITHVLVDVIVSEESSKVSSSAIGVARGLGADAGQRKVAKTYVVHVFGLGSGKARSPSGAVKDFDVVVGR